MTEGPNRGRRDNEGQVKYRGSNELVQDIGFFAVTESQGIEDEHDDEDENDSKFRKFGLKRRASHRGHGGHGGEL